MPRSRHLLDMLTAQAHQLELVDLIPKPRRLNLEFTVPRYRAVHECPPATLPHQQTQAPAHQELSQGHRPMQVQASPMRLRQRRSIQQEAHPTLRSPRPVIQASAARMIPDKSQRAQTGESRTLPRMRNPKSCTMQLQARHISLYQPTPPSFLES